ncbi:MAG: hypothetical protein KGH71_05160 [Candidatus Micrarchaeota archaeon]|nr:hypothetical protein [Candidatus Micrarchaeota archaeon]
MTENQYKAKLSKWIVHNQKISINKNLKSLILQKESDIIVEKKEDSLIFTIDEGKDRPQMLKLSFFTDSTVKINGISSGLNGARVKIRTNDSRAILDAASEEIAFAKGLKTAEEVIYNSYKKIIAQVYENGEKYYKPKGEEDPLVVKIDSDLAKIDYHIECFGSLMREI